MKTKHTPGPWILSGGRTLNVVNSNAEIRIADVKSSATYNGPKSKNEAMANALLIVAAPDLLRELKFVMTINAVQDEDVERINSLIASASSEKQ